MQTLPQLFPDVSDLLITQPDDLVPVMLRLAKVNIQNGIFHPNSVNNAATEMGNLRGPQYGASRRREIEVLLNEVWAIVEGERLIVKAPGINGTNGFRMLTPRGQEIAAAPNPSQLRLIAQFPKALLHPLIAKKVLASLTQNEFGDAVMLAFKAVEVEVRGAAGLTEKDFGPPLMRKAFDPANGALTDTTRPVAEREGISSLFAGAVGSFRGPNAHGTLTIGFEEARDQILLASHLLRMIDTRRRPA